MSAARGLAAITLAGAAALAGLGLAPCGAGALTVDEAAAEVATLEWAGADASPASAVAVSLGRGDVVVTETLPEGVPADDLAVARRAAAAAQELSGQVVTRTARASDGSLANVLCSRASSVAWQQRASDGTVASSVTYSPSSLPDPSAADAASMVATATAYALSDGSYLGPVIDRTEYLTSDDRVFSSYDLLMDYMEEQYLAGNFISFQTCEVFRDDGVAGALVLPNGYSVAPGTGVVTKPDGTQIIPDEYYAQQPATDPSQGQGDQQPGGTQQPADQGGQATQQPADQGGSAQQPSDPAPEPEPEPVPDPEPAPEPEPEPVPDPEPAPEPDPEPEWVVDYIDYIFPDGTVFNDYTQAQQYQEQQALAGNLMNFLVEEHGHYA